MNKYYYDLHIHSCLSPCGDNDSTPNNIAGMGELNGLNIMALTDHNSCKNCPAFYSAARRHGIIPIAGMELTTSEDIHVVCLFESLEQAMAYGDEINSRRILIKNRTDIFGDQLILDENDELIGIEENLLPNATSVSLDEVPLIVEKYGGICYPAHIDRPANGIISVLGAFPKSPVFSCVEIHDTEKISEYGKKSGMERKNIIISSDAHYLWNISEKTNYFELADEPYSGDFVRHELFELLRSKV